MRQTDLEYVLDLDGLARKVVEGGFKRAVVQLPEGLRDLAPKILETLNELGVEAIVSAETCYGACDLAVWDAETVGADVIVHVGHSPMAVRTAIPTLYVDVSLRGMVREAVSNCLELLEGFRRVGVVSTIQHVKYLHEACETLRAGGLEPIVGGVGFRASVRGQVLGCDYRAATSISERVDCFLIICGGRFHPIGLAAATDKPVLVANPYTGRAWRVGDDGRRMLAKRAAAIQRASEAEVFGVLVGIKPGQTQLKRASRILELLRKSGRRAYMFTVGEATVEKLESFRWVDAYVNTACPRIAFDGLPSLRKPLINYVEALVMLGVLGWDEACRSGRLLEG